MAGKNETKESRGLVSEKSEFTDQQGVLFQCSVSMYTPSNNEETFHFAIERCTRLFLRSPRNEEQLLKAQSKNDEWLHKSKYGLGSKLLSEWKYTKGSGLLYHLVWCTYESPTSQPE